MLSKRTPTKITEQVVADVKDCIQSGMNVYEVAESVNIATSTVYRICNDHNIKYPKHKKQTKNYAEWEKINLNYEMHEQGVYNLVCAIITTAANDYRRTVAHMGKPERYRRFFMSDWYELLCSCLDNPIAGDKVIEVIEGENRWQD